jgi:SAM-dependent methyltransferase
MKAVAYELMAEVEDSYWWYRARREILVSVIDRLTPPGSDVIDFGCGSGGTAELLRERGHNVLAADISETALESSRLRGLDTINLKTQRLRESCADCLLAGDVLEHVGDDLGLLLTFRSVLRPGGVLVITVPAYEFLWSGEDYVSEHVRRYTRRGLKEQLRRAGFENIRCSYFNTLLFPAVAAVILAKRLLFPREMYRSNVTTLPRWQNKLLYRVFAVEGRLLRWISFPAGASLIAVAQNCDGERVSQMKEQGGRSGA